MYVVEGEIECDVTSAILMEMRAGRGQKDTP